MNTRLRTSLTTVLTSSKNGSRRTEECDQIAKPKSHHGDLLRVVAHVPLREVPLVVLQGYSEYPIGGAGVLSRNTS